MVASIFVYLCFLITPLTTTNAQAVPGGVGNNLQLWHLTDSLPVAGTGNLNLDWPDATPSSIARPFIPSPSVYASGNTYQMSNRLNYNSCVVLNNEWFESDLNINVNPFQNDINVFTVFKARDNGNIHLWGNGKDSGRRRRGRQVHTEEITNGVTANNQPLPRGPVPYPGNTVNNGAYINHVYIVEGTSSNPANSKIYLNGADIATISTTTTIESNSNEIIDKLLIGVSNRDDNPSIGTDDIDLAEFIVYSGNLGPINRERINSYLGIKYGITLDHNYQLSTGTVVWDKAGHTYNNNIVGIARDLDAPQGGGLSGNLKQNRSKSEHPGDFLELSAPNDYITTTGTRALVVGHNGLATNQVATFNIDNNFFKSGRRTARIWRCQEIGGYTNYNISFNDDIFNNNLPSGFNQQNLVLLVSSDPTFSTGVTAYELRNNGGFQRAQGVSFPSAESYMTIAHMETVTWIKTDASNNTTIGGRVDSLMDQVLGVNDMLGRNKAGVNPAFNTNPTSSIMNFHPYITFNDPGNDNWIERSYMIGHGRNASSTFLIMRNDGSGANPNQQAFLSYATRDVNGSTLDNGNSLLIDNPTDLFVIVDGGGGISSGLPRFDNNFATVISHVRGNNSNNILGVNGVEDNRSYKDGSVLRTNGTLIIGQEQDVISDPNSFDANQRLEGDFAELIMLNERLSPTQTDQVRTYLAVKYGLLLAHDYIASDGSTIWNRTTNSDYNRTIGGVGRDDAFELDQRKTRSQKADAKVTIEHASAFTTNLSHLLWGSKVYRSGTSGPLADYENISTAGAPPGFEVSERHWKVSNPGNRVGAVTIKMDLPTNRTNLAGIRLLISNSPNFNTGFITAEQGNIDTTTGIVEFLGVVLNDGEYFALGFDTDLFYTNNELGAPSTFEACAGDNVTFRYRGLPSHPQDVRFKSNDPNNPNYPFTYPTSISVTNALPDTGGTFKGELTFDIPSDATTGNVLFLDAPISGSVIYNSNAFITIHNPVVSFIPETNPICADRDIELFGFPDGGTFSSTIPGLISPTGDSLYGLGAGWGPNHRDSLDVPVTYTYYPEYTNGRPCPNPKVVTENLTLRDNRLTNIEFAYIVKQAPPAVNNIVLGVNANTITNVTPNILNFPGGFPHPFTFTGTYVTPPPSHTFLADDAQASNPVIFRFNNKGCIGEQSNVIDVYQPLGIPGIPDTLCSEADTIYFYRDPAPQNAYSITTNGGTTVEENRIMGTFTRDPAQQSSVIYVDNTPGSEIFAFVPSNLPPGTTNVTLRMEYRTTTTTANGSTFFSFDAVSSIVITPRPTINLGAAIDPEYCTSGNLDTLRPTPAFDNANTTYFTLMGADTTGSYILPSNLYQDTIFNPSAHYDSLVSVPTRDLPMRLTYTVDRYGCIDHDTAYTIIRAPLRPFFFTKPAYCRNEPPSQLVGGVLPGGVVRSSIGRFEPALGLNDSLGVFDPRLGVIGGNPITYRLTDQIG